MNGSKLKPKNIHAISRASVKLMDSFYTFEFGMDKEIPDDFDMAEIDSEVKELWDDCNAQVDGQIAEIVDFIKSKNK